MNAMTIELTVYSFTCMHLHFEFIISHNTCHKILVRKWHSFVLSDSSPFPRGKGRVFIYTTMRRCGLKLERPLPGQQSTQSDTPAVWVTPGPAARLHCTAQPQETGLKIQSTAPFKGSAGNS